jgi:crotonobetainyl-CoA:carnitine CoA-transferase CaiB-like acyl-CoA transferase
MSEGPLAGIRVFDLTLAMVGPWASMLLGAMGAEVIHIEATDRDLNAGIHPTINGTSIGYLDVQMNKRQIVLDLKSPEDRQHAYDIIKTCDVFLMNMRPDVAVRLGVDYETVSQINDQIVYCAVTGWGPDGPMREIPGADPQVRYIAGFHEATGLEGGDTEVYRHSTQIDETTGNYATQSILMGLLARERTGKGQRVDISMMRATSAMQASSSRAAAGRCRRAIKASPSHRTRPSCAPTSATSRSPPRARRTGSRSARRSGTSNSPRTRDSRRTPTASRTGTT